jgi:hypothetical protein
MRIKIDIKNKKQFWLKGGVEKKNNFNKKIIIMRIKMVKVIYYKFVLKNEIENK